MGGVGHVWRARVRARRPGRLALVVIAAATIATVMTAAGGARRTSSAVARMERATVPGHVLVNPDLGRDSGLDHDAVAALPGVEAIGRASGVLAAVPGEVDEAIALASDGRYGYDVDRPNVRRGRMPDRDRADEIFVSEGFARRHGLRVGGTIDLQTLPNAVVERLGGVEAAFGQGEPPVVMRRFRVVGTGVDLTEIVQDAGFVQERVLLTPAFLRDHDLAVPFFADSVRLRGGDAAVPAFRAAVEQLPHEGELAFQTLETTRERVERAARPHAAALAVFALVVALAGVVLVGQSLARQVHFDADDGPALRALGMSRRALLVSALGPVVPLAAIATVLAAIAATVASRWMPIGPAALAEPDPGVHVDVQVVLVGGLLLLGLVCVPPVVAAWRIARGATPTAPSRRPSSLVAAARVLGCGPSTVTGVHLAVDPGQGRTAVPTRTSIVGGVVAVASVVAALTFATSLEHLVSTPRLFGWNWPVAVEVWPDEAEDYDRTTATIATRARRDPDVVADAWFEVSTVELAGRSVPALGYARGEGDVGPTVARGRLPGRGEIALGIRTMERLGVGVGDRVTARLGRTQRALLVVGRVVLPGIGTYPGSDKTELGAGAVLAHADLEVLGPDFARGLVLVDVRPGADHDAVATRLTRGLPLDDARPAGVRRPADIASYEGLRATPFVLAAVLAVVAFGLVVHALVTTVRRRQRDLALLKTVGFSRRQVGATVAWQASTQALLAAAGGIPLGIVAGRTAWRVLADQLGIVAEPVVPLVLVLGGAAAWVVTANAVAVVPARVAARLTPAAALRAE